MSILDHFPKHLTPRPEQREILLELEAKWAAHDIFSLVMPPGSGKTEVAVTIAAWRAANRETTNYLPPTNVLVEQAIDRYPKLFPMRRMDAYRCEDRQQSCADVKDDCGHLCKGCVFLAGKRKAKAAPVRIMNYYVYFAQCLYADNAVFDEAHQLLEMLQDKQDIKLWQSLYKFPMGLKTVSDVILWAQDYLKTRNDTKLSEALRQIMLVRAGALTVYRETKRRGRSDIVLHVIPASIRSVPPWLWPANKVRKIVLMSATISPHDVTELGLADRRVAYLECGSPIPADRRPVVYQPCYNLSRSTAERAMPELVGMIKGLLAKHPEKGLIHVPYGLAEQLQPLLSDPRLLFHGKDDKAWALDQFRSATVESGRVLIASGLYEGVDLPYDAARWQLIGKIPYLSLGDERIKRKADENPDWYQWEAIKRVVQAAGRIVRAPDDYGVTYIFDRQFGRLLERDAHRHLSLFPQFFRDALIRLR